MDANNAVTDVTATVQPYPVPVAPAMSNFQRARWGALGAGLPLLVRLSGQQHVYESIRSLNISGVFDIIFPVLISIIAAGAVTVLFRDETSIYKLVVLGVSAPALITSWQGYNLAQGTAQAAQYNQQLQILQAPPGSSKPQDTSLFLNPLSLPAVYAAQPQSSSVSPFPHNDPGTLARLGSSLSGSPSASKDYFVILSASPSADVASQRQGAMRAKFPGKNVALFRTPDGYSPTLYCVVLSPNLTFADAQTTQKQALSSVPSAYIWTFGYAVHPTN